MLSAQAYLPPDVYANLCKLAAATQEEGQSQKYPAPVPSPGKHLAKALLIPLGGVFAGGLLGAGLGMGAEKLYQHATGDQFSYRTKARIARGAALAGLVASKVLMHKQQEEVDRAIQSFKQQRQSRLRR